MASIDSAKKNPWGELAAILVAVAVLFYFVEWQKIVAGVTVAVGLGFVIFWHELGHFLVAKWSDVKILKFSIGFGLPGVPPIISYRKGMGFTIFGTRNKEYEELVKSEKEGIQKVDLSSIGETEYAVGVLPLGGFVRMLGEDPADEDSKTTDPRAFANKPVGVRMAIISAGVIMNLILGLVAFMVVYMMGTNEIPAVAGGIAAGSPAYEAGMRPGDEILSIDGRRDITFSDMQRMVALTSRTQKLRLEIKRPGQSEPLVLNLHPIRAPGSPLPTIGIGNSLGLRIALDEPYEWPPGMEGEPKGPDGPFQDEDVIIGANDGEKVVPVNTYRDLERIFARRASQPVDVVVRRTAQKGKKDAVEARVAVPPVHVMNIGARMTMLPISAIQGDSIAAKAGFQINDQILKIDGDAAFDPMRVPEYVYQHAGRPVVFEVARPSASGKSETLTLTATPDDSPPDAEYFSAREPLKIPGLGMAFPALARVVAVDAGSPAAKAGLKPGDEVASMILTAPPADKKKAPKPETIKLDPKNPNWLLLWKVAQRTDPKTKVEIVLARSKQPMEIHAERDPTWFSSQRGLPLPALVRSLPPQPVGPALQRAWRECCDVAFSLYAMIRGLWQQRLPADQAAGVIRIAHIAYRAASAGIDPLTRFLAMLSVNLAVINFLPIPPLDGGQFVFLVAEKIRGRPLPERAQVVLMIAGIVFVLLLFVVVTFNDIMSYFVTT